MLQMIPLDSSNNNFQTTKRNLNSLNDFNSTNTGENTSDYENGKIQKTILPKLKRKEIKEYISSNPNLSGENFMSEPHLNEKVVDNPNNPKM